MHDEAKTSSWFQGLRLWRLGERAIKRTRRLPNGKRQTTRRGLDEVPLRGTSTRYTPASKKRSIFLRNTEKHKCTPGVPRGTYDTLIFKFVDNKLFQEIKNTNTNQTTDSSESAQAPFISCFTPHVSLILKRRPPLTNRRPSPRRGAAAVQARRCRGRWRSHLYLG